MDKCANIQHSYTYKGHNGQIHSITYNPATQSYLTIDQMQMRLWNEKRDLGHFQFPSRTTNFIQTALYLPDKKVYIGAALDGSLRIFDINVRMIGAVATHSRPATCMVYDIKKNQLITAGIDGCYVWGIDGQTSDTYEREWTNNTTYELRKKITMTKKGSWITKLWLESDRDRIYALSRKKIEVFNTKNGKPISVLAKLRGENMTDFILTSNYVVGGCRSGAILVYTENPGSLVATLRGHSSEVTSLGIHKPTNLLVSSSLDGTIRLWDMDILREIHRQEIHVPIRKMVVVSDTRPSQLLCETRTGIHLLKIQYAFREYCSLGSPILTLSRAISSCRKSAEIGSESEDNYSSIIAVCRNMSIYVSFGNRFDDPSCIPLDEASGKLIGFEHNPITKRIFLLSDRLQLAAYDLSDHRAAPAVLSMTIAQIFPTCISMFACPDLSQQGNWSQMRLDASRLVSPATGEHIESDIASEWTACGTERGKIVLLDLRWKSSNSVKEVLQVNAHEGFSVLHLMYNSSCEKLVSYGSDHLLKVWAAATMQKLDEIELPKSNVTCMKMSDTSHLVLCGHEDGTVEIVDIRFAQVEIYDSVDNHAAQVSSADFLDSLHVCATSSLDGTIKIWDERQNLLKELQMINPVISVCFLDTFGGLSFAAGEKIYTIAANDVLPPQLPGKTRPIMRHIKHKVEHPFMIGDEPYSMAEEYMRESCLALPAAVDSEEEAIARESSDSEATTSTNNAKLSTCNGMTGKFRHTVLPSLPTMLVCDAPVLRQRQKSLRNKNQDKRTPSFIFSRPTKPEKPKTIADIPSRPPEEVRTTSRNNKAKEQYKMIKSKRTANTAYSRERPKDTTGKTIGVVLDAPNKYKGNTVNASPRTLWNAVGAADKRQLVLGRSKYLR